MERRTARSGWYPVRLVSGWMLVFIGALVFPLPVPLGLVLIFLGMIVLAHDSRRLRGWMVRLGRRHPDVRDRVLRIASAISSSLGDYLGRFLGPRGRN